MAEGILFALIPLLVLGAVIGAVVYGVMAVTRRRRDFGEVDPGIGTVRSLYFYTVSFVTLMMGVNGVVVLAASVLEGLFGGPALSSSGSGSALALGMSLVIVGIPLWALHWRMIGRHVRQLPVESRSVVRKVYIYVVLAVAAGVSIGSETSVLGWLLGSGGFGGFPWAAIVVWGGVWAFHWQLEAKEGQSTPETRAVRRLYLYLVTAGMLVMAALGIGQIIHIVLREAYGALTSSSLLARSGLWDGPTRDALSLALVAGPVWAAHWLYFARKDFDSALRQLYTYGLAIFGGISTALTALGITLYGVLVWIIGIPEHEAAEAHFRFLPGALASLIVAAGILSYHWSAARRELELPSSGTRGASRSYPYALAAVGLVVVAVGIVALVSTALGLIAESGTPKLVGEDLWRNAIALSITLGVLGAPLFGYYWPRIQSKVSEGDIEERTSLSRRIFIFGVLGVGMLVLVGSASHVIFVFLRELLDGDLSGVLSDVKVSLGIIAAATIFLPYFWMVYRADRRAAGGVEEEERPQARKAVTALVNEGGMGFLQGLEATLGYAVSPLQWADTDAALPELSDDEFRDLAQRIAEASGPNVLLVPDGATVRVLSYR